MNKRRTIFTLLVTAMALYCACSIAFASNAKVDNNTYSHNSRYLNSNTIIIDGIDVSYWQYNVDWEKVKRSGIDYAFIRIGYTGQGYNRKSPLSLNGDSYFESNYKNAKAAGVQVGVYYYAHSISPTEAKKEANYVLKLLNGRDLDLPVVFDIEFADGRLRDAYNNWRPSVRRANMTANSLAFLKTIADAGYEPMFYSYLSMMNSSFDMPLIDGKYKVWIAQYNTRNNYSRSYDFWQYTSSGKVSGVYNSTDCNFWYYNNAKEKTKSGTTSIKNCTVSLGTTSYSYNGTPRKPTVNVTYGGKTLKNGVDYKVRYIKNVLSGTGYAMVKGMGKYSNTALKSFRIASRTISSATSTISSIPSQTYTGSAKKPAITVKYGKVTLPSTSYTVKYSNNINAGTATVTVTGRGNYYGSIKKTFKINKATPKITTSYTSYSKLPAATPFLLNAKTSSGGKLTYSSSNTTVATVNSYGKVTLTGKIGTAKITITSAATANYNGKTAIVTVSVAKRTPTITTSYTSYSKLPGAAPFLLNAKTSSGGKLTYSSSNTAVATVSNDGKVTLTGKIGTAKVTITSVATASYNEKTATVTVSVAKRTPVITTTTNIKKHDKNSPFTINYKTTGDGKVAFKSSSPTIASISTTGRVTIRKAGTVKFTVSTAETETYKAASKVITCTISRYSDYLINGVRNTTVNLKSTKGTGYVKVTWNRSPGFKVNGYQVYRSTKRVGGYTKIATYKVQNYCKNTKNLKKGTTYYYKVRGYRVINGKPYYTKWSNIIYRRAI